MGIFIVREDEFENKVYGRTGFEIWRAFIIFTMWQCKLPVNAT